MGLRVMACLIFTILLAEQGTSAAIKTTKPVVSTIPVFPQIQSGLEKEKFPVLVTVEAPNNVEPQPINLIVVHSVSDKGMLHVAANSIISQLHGADNRIAFVGPPDGDEQPHVVDLSLLDDARTSVQSLKPSTSNIKLKDLFKQAKTLMSKEPGGRAGFILLLTDGKGLVPEDLVDVKGLVKKNRHYTVHVFALGSDHDSDNLQAIASESAGGTYSFVEDVSPSNMKPALAVCLGGLKSVVEPGPSYLVLEPSGEKNAIISNVESGAYSKEKKDRSTYKISIGVLHKGETKKFLVYLDVPSSGTEEDTGCGKNHLLTAKFYSNEKAEPIISVLCIERPPQVVQEIVPSPLVVQEIVRINFINKIRDTETKEELNTKWSTFVEFYQYWSGVDVLLGELEHEIQVMKEYAKPKSTFWAAYFHSWMSSYQTQRPTAMGSSRNVAATFLTQEVNFWLQLHIKVEDHTINFVQSFCPEHECDCIDVKEIADHISKAWKTKEIHARPCSRVGGNLRLPTEQILMA